MRGVRLLPLAYAAVTGALDLTFGASQITFCRRIGTRGGGVVGLVLPRHHDSDPHRALVVQIRAQPEGVRQYVKERKTLSVAPPHGLCSRGMPFLRSWWRQWT